MRKRLIMPLVLVGFVVTCLVVGGFPTLAQINIQKVGEAAVNPVQEAQEKKMAELAEGMSSGAPAEGGESTGVVSEPEPMAVKDIPEDALREAIKAVAGFSMFADTATKSVRSYITKIKVAPRAFEQEFEQGKEPWRSDKSEMRYSPFDPMMISQRGPYISLQPVPPFLPPIKHVKGPISELQALKALVRLRMTSKSGDEYIALAEIAGYPAHLKVGEEIDPEHKWLPSGMGIIVEEISMSSVVFRSGSERLRIAFAEAGGGTEEKPFKIEVTK